MEEEFIEEFSVGRAEGFNDEEQFIGEFAVERGEGYNDVEHLHEMTSIQPDSNVRESAVALQVAREGAVKLATKLADLRESLDQVCVACSVMNKSRTRPHEKFCPLYFGLCYRCADNRHNLCPLNRVYPTGMCFFCGLPDAVTGVSLHQITEQGTEYGTVKCRLKKLPEILMLAWRKGLLPTEVCPRTLTANEAFQILFERDHFSLPRGARMFVDLFPV